MAYIAVIDVETTGLNPYRYDRVIELAALVMGLDGEIIREFATLLNPERDIGPTSIHGLTASDIISAPRFAEVAGTLIDALDGCAATNVIRRRVWKSAARCFFRAKPFSK